jgi:uncharacterized membrane protein YhaH (DUF805 family)
MFSLKGRLSQRAYWQAFVGVFLLSAVFGREFLKMGPERPTDSVLLLLLLLGCVAAYANLAISVKRLHDVGYSGLLAAAVLVPIVQLAFNIWVGALPGAAGPNQYGEAADVPPP